MKIAVFGGSGFVGGHIVDGLIENGHRPSLLVRSGSEHKLSRPERCDLVRGDLTSQDAIHETLQGCDAAVYCVGIIREFPRRGVTFQATQHDGVLSVIAAAGKLGVARLLLMSANGVEAQVTPYQVTKFRADQAALDSGLDVTVFRPSVIFGDPKGKLEFGTQLYRDMVDTPLPAVSFFTGWPPAAGALVMSPVHVDDVVQAFLRALDDAGTIGQVYVLGGPEQLTWQEMIRRVAAAAGRKKWILPVPMILMRLAATLLDWLPVFPVTRDQLTMLAQGNAADPGPLHALIGRQPKAFDVDSLSYLRR